MTKLQELPSQEVKEENTRFQEVSKQGEEEEEEEDSLKNWMSEIEGIIKYSFHDRTLLQQAFTHHSFEEGCSSLERLAYLGDAILNSKVAVEQYSLYPDLDPGKLTRLRAINVDTEKLARAACRHALQIFLRHNIPLLQIQVEEFMNELKQHPLHSCGLIDAPKVLADIVESLIGAVFVDSKSNMKATSEVIKTLLEPMISLKNLPTHPVTKLQEICQRNKFTLEKRNNWKETGEVEYIVDGRFVGKARYGAKGTIAKNRAAQDAYLQIVKALP